MYWMQDREAPFATFLSFVYSYCHPEGRADNFSGFVQRAQRNDLHDVRMVVFRKELIRLLEGDRKGMPPGSIDLAADYDDFDNDDDFLVWLWQQLYPNEPVPGHLG